jgi:hypothetical protein
VVVEPEVKETNKTTLRSEHSGVLERKKKGDRNFKETEKKDLTQPTLLEMPGKFGLPATWVLVPACSIYAADQGLERRGGSLPAYCLSNTTTL